MNRNLIALIIIAFVLIIIIIAIASYKSTPEIVPPDGFIVFENPTGGYAFEAWSPKNIKIGINTHDNENEASLEFWVEHIKNVMTKLKQYYFKEVRDFKTSMSDVSKCLIFEKTDQKVKYLYLAGITCTSSDVYVIEAAGEKEVIEPELAQILKSFETLD